MNRSTKINLTAVALLSCLGLQTYAKSPSFDVVVARTQGTVICQVSGAEGGSANCVQHSSGRGQLTISMAPNSDGSSYSGVDTTFGADGTEYGLSVTAGQGKDLQNIAMVHGRSTDKGFTGGMMISETKSLLAVNIAPLKYEKIDEQTVQVTLGFVAYAPAAGVNMVTGNGNELIQHIIGQIKPLLKAIR